MNICTEFHTYPQSLLIAPVDMLVCEPAWMNDKLRLLH